VKSHLEHAAEFVLGLGGGKARRSAAGFLLARNAGGCALTGAGHDNLLMDILAILAILVKIK